MSVLGIPIMVPLASGKVAKIGHAYGELHVHYRNGVKTVFREVGDLTYRTLMHRHFAGESLAAMIANEIKS